MTPEHFCNPAVTPYTTSRLYHDEIPMVGMRLGGIDPSILRELSGVYKPFVKAFKELVSNAFDADAESVRVAFADDFSSVTVTDDGQGMTPFEFRNDFAAHRRRQPPLGWGQDPEGAAPNRQQGHRLSRPRSLLRPSQGRIRSRPAS